MKYGSSASRNRAIAPQKKLKASITRRFLIADVIRAASSVCCRICRAEMRQTIDPAKMTATIASRNPDSPNSTLPSIERVCPIRSAVIKPSMPARSSAREKILGAGSW